MVTVAKNQKQPLLLLWPNAEVWRLPCSCLCSVYQESEERQTKTIHSNKGSAGQRTAIHNSGALPFPRATMPQPNCQLCTGVPLFKIKPQAHSPSCINETSTTVPRSSPLSGWGWDTTWGARSWSPIQGRVNADSKASHGYGNLPIQLLEAYVPYCRRPMSCFSVSLILHR